jgi:DNA-binding winged helix-turn-helix (wHTH) protein
MHKHPVQFYDFGPFRVDVPNRLLLRNGKEQKVTQKAFDILLVLLANSGQLVHKETILGQVWPDTAVEENNLTVNIAALRKTLRDNIKNPVYIATHPGIGYRFVAEVKSLNAQMPEPLPPSENTRSDQKRFPRIPRFLVPLLALALAAAIALVILIAVRRAHKPGEVEMDSPFDVAEISRVVKESQMYETLKLYTHPRPVNSDDLGYWLPEEMGGVEIKKVKASVQRLLSKGWRYADESRADVFEFRYVKVFEPGDVGKAGTVEFWFIPTLQADGQRVKDRNVYLGRMLVDYKLRKVNGTWLIEDSTMPRGYDQKPSPQPNSTEPR